MPMRELIETGVPLEKLFTVWNVGNQNHCAAAGCTT